MALDEGGLADAAVADEDELELGDRLQEERKRKGGERKIKTRDDRKRKTKSRRRRHVNPPSSRRDARTRPPRLVREVCRGRWIFTPFRSRRAPQPLWEPCQASFPPFDGRICGGGRSGSSAMRL